MSLLLPIKQLITPSLFAKKYYVEFLKSELNLRVHMYLLNWRKTNFFSGISIVSLNQISKLTKLICLYFTGCRNYTNILINHTSYHQILVTSTTMLSKHITSALTAVKDHAIKYSETAFSNSNANYFWSIINSSEVIDKLRLRNFQKKNLKKNILPLLFVH